MKITKDTENKMIITFDKQLDEQLLIETAKYIQEGIENYILSDDYIDIINKHNCYMIPEMDIELIVNGAIL